jgi:hypothetical protein
MLRLQDIHQDLQGGAFKVVKETQPYVAASALYGDSRSGEQVTAAEKEADHIIASLPARDENVIWTINLKGVIADVRRSSVSAASGSASFAVSEKMTRPLSRSCSEIPFPD